MPSLAPPLADLLVRLVEADGDRYDTFVPVFMAGQRGFGLTTHAVEGELHEGLVWELDSLGLVECQPTDKRLGKFRITQEGRTVAAQLAHQSQSPVGLTSWETLGPIRQAIYEAWDAADSPQFGIELDPTTIASHLSPEELRTALTYLRDGGMIEYRDALGPQLPMGVRPSQKTVELLGRWPTNDPGVLADRLLEALDAAIESATNPEDRTRLQKARDALGEVSKTATGGMVVALGKYLTGI